MLLCGQQLRMHLLARIFAGQALVRDMKTHFMAFATILIHNTHGSWIWLAKCMHERNDISLSESLILRPFLKLRMRKSGSSEILLRQLNKYWITEKQRNLIGKKEPNIQQIKLCMCWRGVTRVDSACLCGNCRSNNFQF